MADMARAMGAMYFDGGAKIAICDLHFLKSIFCAQYNLHSCINTTPLSNVLSLACWAGTIKYCYKTVLV